MAIIVFLLVFFLLYVMVGSMKFIVDDNEASIVPSCVSQCHENIKCLQQCMLV
jgi:hypothetical protein